MSFIEGKMAALVGRSIAKGHRRVSSSCIVTSRRVEKCLRVRSDHWVGLTSRIVGH
jgi:hypothetical protein